MVSNDKPSEESGVNSGKNTRGHKRDLSPTTENSPTDSGTKKLKGPEPEEKCTSTSSRTNLESTDNTQFTVTSGGPGPFTRGSPNIL